MESATPLSLATDLQLAFIRYFNTAYWLRDERLMQEREALISREGVLSNEPLLEPVIPYDPTVALTDVAVAAGIDVGVAESVGQALFGRYTNKGHPIRLREHQAETVLHTYLGGTEPGRNVVVTSGTGSGKTEKLPAPNPVASHRREHQVGAPGPTQSVVGGLTCWVVLRPACGIPPSGS